MKSSLAAVIVGLLLANSGAANPLAEMNAWVEQTLSASHSTWVHFLLLVVGGGLASLLPCVYPLYPITAGIVLGRAQAGPRWPQPVAYYLGLAFMYGCLGLMAGITGGAFNAVLRLPLVNLVLALLFLVLALGTSGFLHLDLFSSSVREDPPGLLGTFLMGMGAGLLSSSCVGPFVISILLNIASSSTGFDLAASLEAGLKMLAFGLGLGIPFLLVGLFGARLPKSGSWMKYIQWTLALWIGWFSYGYLEKGLSGWGYEATAIQLVFAGGMLLLFAVYRLQSQQVEQYQRMANAVYVLLAVVAFLALARGILPVAATTAALSSVQGQRGPAVQQKGNLTWYLDRSDAVAAAQQSGKRIFVDFYGSWCANCKAFEQETQTNAALNQALRNVVLLKVQDTDPEFKEWQSDSRFPELKVGLPFFIIMDAAGNMIYKTSDYTRTEEMMLFLNN